MTKFYCPEMNEARPVGTQIDAHGGHYGGWFLDTPLILKGRGIRHLTTYTAEQLTPQAQHKVGWHQYKVTDLAFEKLETTYLIAVENIL